MHKRNHQNTTEWYTKIVDEIENNRMLTWVTVITDQSAGNFTSDLFLSLRIHESLQILHNSEVVEVLPLFSHYQAKTLEMIQRVAY